MNSNDYNEVVEILSDLLHELVTEEDKLKSIVNNSSYRIDELNQQIDTCRKNEDIDFRVFSPRNISYDNSEKISSLENERSDYERAKSEAEKRIGYYSGKADKLKRAISLVKNINFDNMNSVIDVSLDEVEKDPFEYLFRNNDIEEDEKSEDSIIDERDNIDSKDVNNIDDSIDSVKDNSNNISIDKSNTVGGIPVTDVKRVCHKIEFTEKIINNDRIRAKMELKDSINELQELIRVYE